MKQVVILTTLLFASLILSTNGARGETRLGLGRKERRVKGVMRRMSRPKAPKMSKKPKMKCSDSNDNDLASDVSAFAPTAPSPNPSTASCAALQVCRLRLSYVDGAYARGHGRCDWILLGQRYGATGRADEKSVPQCQKFPLCWS